MRRPWITYPLLLSLAWLAVDLVLFAPDWWAMLVCSFVTPLLDFLPISLTLNARNFLLAFIHGTALGVLTVAGLLTMSTLVYSWLTHYKSLQIRLSTRIVGASVIIMDVMEDLRDTAVWLLVKGFIADWRKRISMGRALVREPVAWVIALPVLLGACLWLNWDDVCVFLGIGVKSEFGMPDASSHNLEIIYKLSLIIGGITAFVLATWRGWCHDRQTRTTMQGHITDRFIKASELLGSEQMASRLGGIFMLWRTGKDSPNLDDKRAVLDMLCAFIREPTPDSSCDCFKADGGTEANTAINGEPCNMRADVRSAITLFSKNSLDAFHVPAYYPFDLSGATLPNSRFYKSNLSWASFNNADLRWAFFYESVVCDSMFYDANLSHAFMQGAKMERAKLINTDLSYANMTRVKLRDANICGAIFLGAFVLSNPDDLYSRRLPFTRDHCVGANAIEHAIFTGDSCPWPPDGNQVHGEVLPGEA